MPKFLTAKQLLEGNFQNFSSSLGSSFVIGRKQRLKELEEAIIKRIESIPLNKDFTKDRAFINLSKERDRILNIPGTKPSSNISRSMSQRLRRKLSR